MLSTTIQPNTIQRSVTHPRRTRDIVGAEEHEDAAKTRVRETTVVMQPYLFFDGRCQEAIDFYKQALGAEVLMQMRFQDSPDPQAGHGVAGDKIMHASLRIQDSVLMLSDGMCRGAPSFQGFALSLTPADDADAKRLFDALSEGGTVTMPLQKTFWASCFGMVTDRFGVGWMVNVEQSAA